jgi:hypothetical protein
MPAHLRACFTTDETPSPEAKLGGAFLEQFDLLAAVLICDIFWAMSNLLTISEVSLRSGVAASALRFYEERPRSRRDSSSIHLQKITIDPEGKLETAVDQAVAIVIAFLVGYLYAASRNWVWCPGWLMRLVTDEKKRSRSNGKS